MSAKKKAPEEIGEPESKLAPNSIELDKSERLMHREQLRGGLWFRRQYEREDRWRSYIRILGHNFYESGVTSDHPTINMVAARVRAQPPKLAFGTPNFELTSYGVPPSPNSEAAHAAALTMIWKQEDYGTIFRRSTLDWPTFGQGVLYTGFERGAEGEILDEKRKLLGVVNPETTEKMRKVGKVAKKIVDTFSQTEVHSIKTLHDKRLFLERTGPLDFVIDPCASSWDDAQFMGRRLFLPKHKAKMMFGDACPEIDSVANVALYSDSNSDDPFGDDQDLDLKSKLPDAVKRVAVWEVWNISTRRTIYHDAADGKVIAAFEWKAPHPGFPFVPLLWDEIPDSPIPEGLAAALKPMNDELHEIRRREIAEANKAFGKTRVSGHLDADALRALKSRNDGEIVRVPDDVVIEPITRQPMPSDFWQLENRIKEDMNEVSHTSPYDAQAMPEIKRTATEASMVQSSSDAMLAFRQLSVERAASMVADRMLALLMTTVDDEIILRIVNKDPDYTDPETDEPKEIGALIDFAYVPTEHFGQYEITVSPGSMLAAAKDIERNQLVQSYEMFSPEPWFDRRAFAIHFFSTMPSIRNPKQFIIDEELLAPPAPPEQPPMQQPMMPPEMQGMMPGMMPEQPPMQQPMMPPEMGMGMGAGIGSPENQLSEVDMMAAVMGGNAPFTG